MSLNVMKRIAIGQFCSSSDLSRNLVVITDLIKKAIENDVKVIFFPEASDYLSRDATHSKKLATQSPVFLKDLQATVRSLSKNSKNIDVAINLHMPPSKSDIEKGEERLKNVLLYINNEGELVETYEKLHLFDVDVPNGPVLKESNSCQPGSRIGNIVSTPVGKLGLGICYDVRFPELSLQLRTLGAEIICFPSAFTMKTGQAHWELLARSRAIDTQCFVIMPGQSGKHDVYTDISDSHTEKCVERISWGHSIIVDPWGTVIARSDLNKPADEPQLIIADLDFNLMNSVRTKMPLWEQRRRDIFK